MCEENLATVRRGIEAFNRRDVEGFAELVTHDFVWLPALAGAVEAARYVGRSGVSRYFAESDETWEQLTVVGDELRALDDDVLMLGRATGRGFGSGAPVEMPLAFLAEFRDKRISKVSTFRSHADALEAAGLDE